MCDCVVVDTQKHMERKKERVSEKERRRKKCCSRNTKIDKLRILMRESVCGCAAVERQKLMRERDCERRIETERKIES